MSQIVPEIDITKINLSDIKALKKLIVDRDIYYLQHPETDAKKTMRLLHAHKGKPVQILRKMGIEATEGLEPFDPVVDEKALKAKLDYFTNEIMGKMRPARGKNAYEKFGVGALKLAGLKQGKIPENDNLQPPKTMNVSELPIEDDEPVTTLKAKGIETAKLRCFELWTLLESIEKAEKLATSSREFSTDTPKLRSM